MIVVILLPKIKFHSFWLFKSSQNECCAFSYGHSGHSDRDALSRFVSWRRFLPFTTITHSKIHLKCFLGGAESKSKMSNMCLKQPNSQSIPHATHVSNCGYCCSNSIQSVSTELNNKHRNLAEWPQKNLCRTLPLRKSLQHFGKTRKTVLKLVKTKELRRL